MLFGKFRTRLETHRNALINHTKGRVADPVLSNALEVEIKDCFYNITRELDELEESVMKTKGSSGFDLDTAAAMFDKFKKFMKTDKE